MAIVKGPFDLAYGANVLAGVETIAVNYSVDTTDYDTIQGRRYQLPGGHLVTVTADFLESDVASLQHVLPQYYVANGGTLSTGETVTNTAGAIDVVPGGCENEADVTDLVITSCGNPGQVLRIVDCATEIDGVSIDNKRRTVSVAFRGQSTAGTIQMFTEGAVTIVS